MDITPEMDKLEKQKTFYAHQMRLHDLMLSELKLQQNLTKVKEEIEATKATIEKIKD